MLTEEIKSIIEKESQFSPRLTGVFFRKNFNQSMYDADGLVTEFAAECHRYFSDLKHAAEKKAFQTRLEQERVQYEQQQVSIKRANQTITKSANQARASFIGSLRFNLQAGVLVVRALSRSMPNPAQHIRRYLKKLGVNRLGNTLVDGVSFSGDAVTEVLDLLRIKQAQNSTVPYTLATKPLPYFVGLQPTGTLCLSPVMRLSKLLVEK